MVVRRSLFDQIFEKCKHFNGLMNKHCDSGVSYADVRDEGHQPTRYPCFRGSMQEGDPETCCASQEFPSREEAEAEEREVMSRFAAWRDKLTTNICPTCDKPFTEKSQVGRCVYAKPCGHRLYQGTLPRGKR